MVRDGALCHKIRCLYWIWMQTLMCLAVLLFNFQLSFDRVCVGLMKCVTGQELITVLLIC